MTDQSEGFVQEVTEELRRDRITGYAKRYGWIAVALIVGAVGFTAYNERQKAQTAAAAQAKGDALLSALDFENIAEQKEALAAIEGEGADISEISLLLSANLNLENDAKDEALTKLDQIAALSQSEIYRDLAQLKAVMIRGADQGISERVQILDTLSIPGRPFRISALEQKALVLIADGQGDAAISLLDELSQEPGVSQNQIARWRQLTLALGKDEQEEVTQSETDQ